MAAGYLLDTNVISVLLVPSDSRHQLVTQHLRSASMHWISEMSVAEIEFGLRCVRNPDHAKQDDLRRRIQETFADPLPFSIKTIEPYSMLRAELWNQCGKRDPHGRYIEKIPENLVDSVTGLELGIDERDLIIASVAMENTLFLATLDRNEGMKRIEAAAKAISGTYTLEIKDWSKVPGTV